MDTGSRVRGPQKNVSPHVWTTHRYGLLASSSRYTTQYPLFILSKAQTQKKKKKKKVKNLWVVPFSMLLAGVAGYASTFPAHILMSPLLTLLKKQKQKLHLLINLQFHFFFFFERHACFYAQIHIFFVR